MSAEEHTFKVDLLTRVEGEGRFFLRVKDGRVLDARLAIFEAPRYFEALLRERSIHEVPDIVARICGICPVAYQMSAVCALENALACTPPPGVRALRRLLYCGEWIESHALHVFLLHAPDFLGYPSALEMAADHRELVERGLRMKKAGNALIELLGGRAIHPVSVRVGGFTRAPSRTELRALEPELTHCLEAAEETVRWASGLSFPELERDHVFVALESTNYPLEHGEGLRVSGHGVVAVDEFDELFVEEQVEHSNALQCRLRDGRPYLCGPMARVNLAYEKLHPRAAIALESSALRIPFKNPHRSIIARAVELVHAFAEALGIIADYARPDPPFAEAEPREASGSGATEAPRGLLFHRYSVGADGLVRQARIVPPTSQNQACIEADLASLAPELIELEHEQATHLCEQLIRSYDPCISCATHFLRLDIQHEAEGTT